MMAWRSARGGLVPRIASGCVSRQQSRTSSTTRILLTGSCGQVGSELLPHLRSIYGTENVIATDVRESPSAQDAAGPFFKLDVTDALALERAIVDHRITGVVHLAALLSATGEQNPLLALQVNNMGVTNVLEAARVHSLSVFSPSTIAVFGPSTPRELTPDETVMRPTTMYGVTKVHLELLGEYYHSKFGVDFRSLRYPGVISSAAMPGGGTTDYAVEIYHEALSRGTYTCFLKAETMLPMMYMPDLLRATTDLMLAPSASLTQRTYNVGAISFTPAELAASIQKEMPGFTIDYAPDFRQTIAATWPQRLDDSVARRDWGWNHAYDLDGMTRDMLQRLGPVHADRVAAVKDDVLKAAEKRRKMIDFLSSGDEPVRL